MLRLIRMDRQVVDLEGHRQFAFWDTVRDRFLSLDGEWSWECCAELLQSARSDLEKLVATNPPGLEIAQRVDHIQRCIRLASSVPEYVAPPRDAG